MAFAEGLFADIGLARWTRTFARRVVNEALGDQALREHYQVWRVYCPADVPIPLNRLAIL